jgi:hypothetical protein
VDGKHTTWGGENLTVEPWDRAPDGPGGVLNGMGGEIVRPPVELRQNTESRKDMKYISHTSYSHFYKKDILAIA